GLAFLTLLAGDSALRSQTRDRPKLTPKGETLMRAKLTHAKDLLEGIALADYKKIRNCAEELIQLSKKAEWRVVPTPRYERFSNEFRRAAEGIIQKARAKNLDGVTLSYFEMTMSCVRCHLYVREVRDARLPAPPHETAVALRPGQ